jgi:ubiquinone/menaquinone biosynthesis C-methylase UbiE
MLTLRSKVQTRYILQVGEEARSRLDLLHELHGKYSQQYINTLSIQPKAAVLDIGGGVGNMTCWFVKNFLNSSVVKLDNSEKQLAVARKRIEKKNLSNIDYQVSDLENFLFLEKNLMWYIVAIVLFI